MQSANSVVLDEDRLREIVAYLRTQEAFCFDTETMGEFRGIPHLNNVTWLGLAAKGNAWAIPMGHPIGDKVTEIRKEPRLCTDGKIRRYSVPVYEGPPQQLDQRTVFDIMRPLFFDERITKIGHNLVFDLGSTAKYYGEVMPGPYFDTIVGSWLLDENRKRNGLKYLTKDLYGFGYDDEEVGKCIEKHPFSKVAHYLICDVRYPWFMYNDFLPRLKQEDLMSIFDIEMGIVNVLTGMRLTGFPVDEPRLTEMKGELADRIEGIRGDLYRAAGRKFNVNSNPQKQSILYGKKTEGNQGLKPWKKTDAGRKKADKGEGLTIHDYSTDAESLESFAGNPVVASLLEFQEADKILGTYVLGYLGDETKKDKRPRRIHDGRIYAEFVSYGTNSGRFSCREPNLTNIPRASTPLGELVRGAFCAPEGWQLVVGDYGQIELRLLAHYTQRGKLYEGFLKGQDPHRINAASVLGKAPEDVTGDERQKLGKTMGFAMGYGAGVGLVASMAGVSMAEAKRILNKMDRENPEIPQLRRQVINTALSRDPHYIRSLLGRKRRMPDLSHPNSKFRTRAERQLFNFLFQGGNADLTKLAMIRADSMLAEQVSDEVQLMASVHDEIVVLAPEHLAQKTADVLREAMIGPEVQKLIRVPLTVDIGIARRWSEAK